MKSKNFIKTVIAGTLLLVVMFGTITAVIDPYFHYHKPLKGLGYELAIDNERYQNDGITKRFSYDAVITGTSMTENFKASEFDEKFGVSSIKVPFSGGSYKEVNKNLETAFQTDNKIKSVLRALDYSAMMEDKDSFGQYSEFPEYLYDDNLFNDTKYLLNKEVMLRDNYKAIVRGGNGQGMTDFDEYANWNSLYNFGKESVLETYTRPEVSKTKAVFDEKDRKTLVGNIKQNVTDICRENPQTTFYLFFTPYSIAYWDCLQREGRFEYCIEMEKLAIEEILKVPNIKLFSFTNAYDMVCNLDNYKDQAHYGEWVNSEMLEAMKEGKYQLTQENYKDYLEDIRVFYSSYDYDSIYE